MSRWVMVALVVGTACGSGSREPTEPPATPKAKPDSALETARAAARATLAAARAEQTVRLAAYRDAGRFPRNHISQDRIPIFVDEEGNRCAVADLMTQSGATEAVEQIRTTNNFVYIAAVHDGPLIEWVLQSGLTQEEAALIQPSYYRDEIRPFGKQSSELVAHFDRVLLQLERDTDASLTTAVERLLCARGTNGADCTGIGAPPGPAPAVGWQAATVPAIDGPTALAVGDMHACAADRAGAVTCWDREGAARRIELPPATHLAARDEQTCAVQKNGGVTCWGNLRFGDATIAAVAPRPIKGVTGASRVAIGERTGCAVLRGGKVACWGHAADPLAAAPVSGVSGARSVSVGEETSCAVVAKGGLRCWRNRAETDCDPDDDMCGTWKPLRSIAAAELDEQCVEGGGRCPAMKGVAELTHGERELIAMTSAGSVLAYIPYGVTPDGGYDSRTLMRTGATQLVADEFTCTRMTSGAVQCWDGPFSDDGRVPVPTPSPITQTSVLAVGGAQLCGIHEGSIACWRWQSPVRS